MALHFNGRDKDGTHRISGSSDGHGKAEPGKRALDYPFQRNVTVAHTDNKFPISMNIDFHMGGYKFEGQGTFTFSGDVEATDLSTISVYRNGLALEENQYKLDLINKSITLSSPIRNTDDTLEIRARRGSLNAMLVPNVLILKTSKGVTSDMLKHFAPSVGEVVNKERIMKYEWNNISLMNVPPHYTTFEVVGYEIEPDGIYATLKIY